MATVTAQQLINEALHRADQVSGFVDTTDGGEVYELINSAISELYDILGEAQGEIYLASEALFSTVIGQEKYPLATVAGATFYRLLGIDQSIGGKWQDCDRYNWADRNTFNQGYSVARFKYALVDTNIRLQPTPTSIQSMKLWYLPLPPTLSASGGTVDLLGPWREFVTLHIAIEMANKEENDVSAMLIKKAGLEARIRAAGKQRDSNQPITVQDTEGNNTDYLDPWGF